MKKVNLIFIIVFLLAIGCSSDQGTSYRYVEIYSDVIPEKERYGYEKIITGLDTTETEITAGNDSIAYVKALKSLFRKRLGYKEMAKVTTMGSSYPDTFFLYNNESKELVSGVLSKSKIEEIAKEYDIDNEYEVYEELGFAPNSSGIRRVYAIIKIDRKHKDNLEMVLKEMHKMRSENEYLIVFGYLETPPSFKEWNEKDMLDKDVNRMTAIYRKGKQTAYATFNIPANGGGFIE